MHTLVKQSKKEEKGRQFENASRNDGWQKLIIAFEQSKSYLTNVCNNGSDNALSPWGAKILIGNEENN